jgi:hypothetical protein
MALINHTISGLYGGVSQQSPDVRIENQCEESINCNLSVIDGISKRGSTSLLLKDNNFTSNSKIFLINKVDEKYMLVFTGNDIEPLIIYDLNNNERKVLGYEEEALNYLKYNINNVKEEIDLINLADNTIIVNNNVICKMVDTYNYENSSTTAQDEIKLVLFEKDLVVNDELYFSIIDEDNEINVFDVIIEDGDTIDDVKDKMENGLLGLNDDYNYTINIIDEKIEESCPEFKDGLQYYKWGDTRLNWYNFLACVSNGETGYSMIFGSSENNPTGFSEDSMQYVPLFLKAPSTTCADNDGTFYYTLDEIKEKAVFVKKEDLDYYSYFYSYTSDVECDNIQSEKRIEIIVDGKTSNYDNLFHYNAYSFNNLSPFGNNVVSLRRSEGVINITKGVIKTYYEVNIGDYSFNVTTGDGVDDLLPMTTEIARALENEMNNDEDFTSKFYVENFGNSLYIKNKNNIEFSLSTTDSYGDTALTSFKNITSSVQDLPNKTKEGYIININPDSENTGGYYLKYKNGEWVETLKEYINYMIDYNTMPITLQESNGEFFLKRINYKNKKVGDDIITPNPSFINNKINKIFFYKNRLCFSSGQNLIFSRSDNYFDFFYTTATDLLDDDYIDIAVGSSELSDIQHISTFNENLIVMTSKNQFNISSNGKLFTATNVSSTPLTSFDNNKKCKPTICGSNLYFTSNSGDFSIVREYYVQSDTLINDAANITSHVPKYLPNELDKIVYESNTDSLFFLKSNTNIIYVYNYKWQGNTKIQSAWSKMQFNFNIIDFEIIDSEIFLLIESNNNYEIVKSSFNKNLENFEIYLDRKVNVIPIIEDNYVYLTYNGYNFENDNEILKNKYSIINERGFKVNQEIIYVDENTIKFLYNGDDSSIYIIGENYESIYTLSEINFKSQNSNVAENAGRLQLRNMIFSYTDSLNFKIRYSSNNRFEKIKEFTGTRVGLNLIGELKTSSGDFKTMIAGRNKNLKIDIINDSYLPFFIQSLTWIGFYTKRTQSI